MNGDAFNFYKSYDVDGVGKSKTYFSDIGNFGAFDIAYESDDPLLARKVDRLMAFHMSEMYKTPPTLTPPIWELDDNGSYPRLVQLRD